MEQKCMPEAAMEIIAAAEQIKKLYDPAHTLVVGIDGLGGAGKSTLSEKLCQLLRRDHAVALFHIDDFIHPRAVRYNDGYAAWECYYTLQWRYDYLLDAVVNPIKCGDFIGKVELYDKDNDTYFFNDVSVPVGSIVIIEGIFLQRPELDGAFDYVVFIDVPEKTRLDRVLERDGYIGTKAEIREKYDNRYFPAERYYAEMCVPSEKADYIIKM